MTIAQHLAEPHVSLDGHARRRIIELGESLKDRRAIYLDTRFWVHLRDAAMGRAQGASYLHLLRVLRDNVSVGRAFCPMNGSTFIELLKQTDTDCRRVTASLVDELSLGAALLDEERRVATELAYLLHKHGQSRDLHPLAHLVWVRLPYVFGISHPVPTALDSEQSLALGKAFFDLLWDASAVDIFSRIPDRAPYDDLSNMAARLNRGNADHADQVRSFHDTYQNELAGTLDLCASQCAAIMHGMFERQTGQQMDIRSGVNRDAKLECYSLLVGMARAGKGARTFPTLHAQAKCHAAIRWDRTRKLNSNTLFDLHHGIGAVVYCDAFLTDRGMRTLLTQNHVALDKEFGCAILSDVADATALLESGSWTRSRPNRYFRDA